MTRLIVHVEGQTEETFVNEIIAPYLYSVGYHQVCARLLGNARLRNNRGGIRSWSDVKKEINRHLSGDTGCVATTMVDYYALPENWPGRATAPNMPFSSRGAHVHDALRENFDATSLYGHRFEPFVLMHEFEALLFSDCEIFATSIGYPNKAEKFQNIRNLFPCPEAINDSPQTAPSKRIIGILPEYQKPLFGNIAAMDVGLQKIREECPHFSAWLERLEQRLP